MLKYTLHNNTTCPDEYKKAKEWINTIDGISIDIGSGFNHISGVTYYSYINFDDEELLLLFKLMFPKLKISHFLTNNRSTYVED